MKKNYVKPKIRVIELDMEPMLLTMSGTDSLDGPVGAPSKHRNKIWDDEEEEDIF